MLDGNFYDFGAFSECFHIERKRKLYQTKYCMGQVVLDLKGRPLLKSHNTINGIFVNKWQISDDQVSSQIAPFFIQQ